MLFRHRYLVHGKCRYNPRHTCPTGNQKETARLWSFWFRFIQWTPLSLSSPQVWHRLEFNWITLDTFIIGHICRVSWQSLKMSNNVTCYGLHKQDISISYALCLTPISLNAKLLNVNCIVTSHQHRTLYKRSPTIRLKSNIHIHFWCCQMHCFVFGIHCSWINGVNNSNR